MFQSAVALVAVLLGSTPALGQTGSSPPSGGPAWFPGVPVGAGATNAQLAAAAVHGQSQPARTEAQEVRIVLMKGAPLTGRLVSLTATDVTWRKGDLQDTIPLSDVLRVERVTHRARGLPIVGFAAGYIGCLILFSEADEIDAKQAGLMFGMIGAGVGALVGLNIDSRPRVLYRAPAGTQRIAVRPLLGAHGAGLAVTLGW